MTLPERVLSDPRLVTGTLGGQEYHFWLHRRGYRIAEERHGYVLDSAGIDDPMDGVMRLLWVAALPFSPDMSFDDFDLSIMASEYEEAVRLHNEVVERQIGKEPLGKAKAAKAKAAPKKKK